MSVMRDTRSVSDIPVRHILKDGTVLKDIGGHRIPKDHPVYRVLKMRGCQRER